MSDPRFLTVPELIAINEAVVSSYGGVAELPTDTQSMISVIGKARSRWQMDGASIPVLAADYAFSIIHDRPFPGGNRRTALAASCTFLGLNGYQLRSSEAETAVVFVALAAGGIDEKSLAGWFDKYAEPLKA